MVGAKGGICSSFLSHVIETVGVTTSRSQDLNNHPHFPEGSAWVIHSRGPVFMQGKNHGGARKGILPQTLLCHNSLASVDQYIHKKTSMVLYKDITGYQDCKSFLGK